MNQVQQAPVDFLPGNDSGFIVTAIRAALAQRFPRFDPKADISTQKLYDAWRESRVPERNAEELYSLILQPIQNVQRDKELFYALPHILAIPAENIYKGNWLDLWKAMSLQPVAKKSVEHGDDTPYERLDSFHIDPSELVEQEIELALTVSVVAPSPEPEKIAFVDSVPKTEKITPAPTLAPAEAEPKDVAETTQKIVPGSSPTPTKSFKITTAPARQQRLPFDQQERPRPAVVAPVVKEEAILLSDRSIFDEEREATYRPKARIVSTSTSSTSGGFLLTTNEIFKKTSGLCTHTKNFRGIEMRCSRPIDEDSIDRRCKAHPDVS